MFAGVLLNVMPKILAHDKLNEERGSER
jgi:hypothetical protein